MTGAENNLNEIICLQLKKPKNWNWELSTSKSSPHIALPTIQLFNSKGQLLIETNDNGTTNRQSWHSSQTSVRERSRERENKNSSKLLQRCRSDNLERRLARYRSPINSEKSNTIESSEPKKQLENIQRCRSGNVPSQFHINRKTNNSDSIKDSINESFDYIKKDRKKEVEKDSSKETNSGVVNGYYKSSKGKFGQLVEKGEKKCDKIGGIYYLQKSRSDVLDIKVKTKQMHSLSDRQPLRPYQHRSGSGDLVKITRHKYDLHESLKRAESDGYKKFIYNNESRKDIDEKGKKKRLAEYLATAETVFCDNTPINLEVNNVVQPKKYRLRQSRAGILVISDESFSSSHRRRCHGEYGDCRGGSDEGDIIVIEKNGYKALPKERQKESNFRYKPNRSRPEKDKCDVNRTTLRDDHSRSRHFRQSSDPAGVKMAKFLPNRYEWPNANDVCNNVGRRESTRNSTRSVSHENYLFYSKSDVFPFSRLLHNKDNHSLHNFGVNLNDIQTIKLDDNGNYITEDQTITSNSDSEKTIIKCGSNYTVQEPLTTPNTESGKPFEQTSTEISESSRRKKRKKVRRGYSDGSTSSNTAESRQEKGPLTKTTKPRKGGDCDLLQLVRRISSPKEGDQRPAKVDLKLSKTSPSIARTHQKPTKGDQGLSRGCQSLLKSEQKAGYRHVTSVMGANVSRHSTKGLSGRRSQSSGSICNGKGRHQGDGSGKGSGGSLPSYLDDRESTCNNNHHEDCEKAPLDEVDRIPPLGDGAPLHWKFSDTQTAICQDQGYGSERSPEEEYPPPLPDHDLNQCHHHLEAHSCYPFITPESTFSVKLAKGSRGLGLSVTGGVDSAGSWPGLVRIKRLFPHQPASSCGLLNVGDLLLEANGVPLTGLTNYEALEVLRTASNQVELRVCRPPPDVLNCVSPISEVPPPPPARREPPSSLNLPSIFHGSTPEDEYYHGEFEVTLTKIQGSLGFTLRKEDDSALGHYVRALVREPALTDGRIKAGDKIIAVNDVEISPMSHEQAVQYLRQCGDKVKLRLYRDSAQTPVAALSPTETTPRTSFSRKANLRQEAVDMLNDIAVRKLIPGNQECSNRRSFSPTSSPRRLRRHAYPSDASQESVTKYVIPEEQFHEGLLQNCSHFEDDAFNSLFSIESDDGDRPSRPSSLDLYNPNQTPVAARKPRFNFSLAHNAYELNNLDPEVLDAPNLTYNLGNDEGNPIEGECGDSFPKEPASMPHIPLDNPSMAFSYKNPAYQSAHPQCSVETDVRSSGTSRSSHSNHKPEETDLKKVRQGILKHEEEKYRTKTESVKMTPMKEEYEILAIELNRGWNSRLGFSLQGAAGVTYVSAVHADSVAAKDGRIRPGDRIMKVNDESVEHLNTNEIIDLLRIVRGPVCIVVKRIKSNEDCPKSNAEN